MIQYVDLLFAGAPGAEDMKQEILQNTLDRYDDLISQGKSEEAAYRLAISGIGDINELLDAHVQEETITTQMEATPAQAQNAPIHARRLRAAAIAMYITCAIPLFIFSELGLETIGLCLTLLLVAAATCLLIMSRQQEEKNTKSIDPRKKRLNHIIRLPALTIWLLLSVTTQAWFITWLIFPIAGCVKGLINAIIDLKEENRNEN